MVYEPFDVIEINRTHGFAKLRSPRGGGVYHCELYPEDQEGEVLALQVGDRVQGLARGESVSRVTWLRRAEPPAELTFKMRVLVGQLKELGFEVSADLERLTESQWRSRSKGLLWELLVPQLPLLFDEELHPFEDPQLLNRFAGATREVLPDFEVRPIAGRPELRVEPGGWQVEVPEAAATSPAMMFKPLVTKVNELLAARGSEQRWHWVSDNALLAKPALVELLVRSGVLRVAQ